MRVHHVALLAATAAAFSPASPSLLRSRTRLHAAGPVKIQLNVCKGKKCQAKPNKALVAALADSEWASMIDVSMVECFDACGKGPNVGIANADGSGLSLPGMSEPERLRRTFMKVEGDEGVDRVVAEVSAWLADAPARAAAAAAAFNDDPDLALDNAGCDHADLALLIKRLSKRDMSAKGYSREKLLGLLRTRCGPLGVEAAEKEAKVA